MDIDQIRGVDLDRQHSTFIVYGVDGGHQHLRFQQGQSGGTLTAHIVPCDTSNSGRPCSHEMLVLRNSSIPSLIEPRPPDAPDRSPPRKKKRGYDRVTPSEIAGRMSKMFKGPLATSFTVKPLHDSVMPDVKVELNAHKNNYSSGRSPSHGQSDLLRKFQARGKVNKAFLAVLEHLLRCADICEFGWNALGPNDRVEAKKVGWRHRILSAALKKMKDEARLVESVALTILVGLTSIILLPVERRSQQPS